MDLDRVKSREILGRRVSIRISTIWLVPRSRRDLEVTERRNQQWYPTKAGSQGKYA